MTVLVLGLLSGALVGIATALVRQLKRRHMDRWIGPYVLQAARRPSARGVRPIHILFCISDHFEPQAGGAGPEQAMKRVQAWLKRYPRAFADFRDSDGRTPRHTFFYPMEMYEAREIDAISELCAKKFGEVEAHLHHDNDSPESLRKALLDFKETMSRRHGLLSRSRATGETAYGFIHGNWALCNSRPDGRWCGVNDELTVLRETGCYADFTFPSAPSPTQTGKINSIYYARSAPQVPGLHGTGTDIGTEPVPPGSLLLFQGPLLLDWRHRRYGVLPAIENGCIQHSQPVSEDRLWLWLQANIKVPSRPDWYFVKLHTHGAPEANHEALLGDSMIEFHRSLRRIADENPGFNFHYVTAREMYNLAKAAEAGWKGPVSEALDYELLTNIK